MPSTPFIPAVLLKPSFFQRLLGKLPKDDAVIELNNLLAASPVITAITANQVAAIQAKHHVSFIKTYLPNMKEFYGAYLKFCLMENNLTDEESGQLVSLKRLLGLNDAQTKEIHDAVAGSLYKDRFKEAVAGGPDGAIPQEQKAFLEKLKTDIHLPEDIAESIIKEVKTEFLTNYFHGITAHERISPEEERHLEAISKNLGVDMQMDEKTREKFNKYKLYWIIENGELPALNTGINLTKGEPCHFKGQADWFEKRRITTRIDYAGPVARIRIMKGVYYRVGSISPHVASSEEWRQIDSGNLFLTSKRLIFMGGSKNTAIKLDKILSFTPYSDGVEIEKDAGRIPLLKFSNNADIFCMMLSRLLKEN